MDLLFIYCVFYLQQHTTQCYQFNGVKTQKCIVEQISGFKLAGCVLMFDFVLKIWYFEDIEPSSTNKNRKDKKEC